jgi:hypothetical protein
MGKMRKTGKMGKEWVKSKQMGNMGNMGKIWVTIRLNF